MKQITSYVPTVARLQEVASRADEANHFFARIDEHHFSSWAWIFPVYSLFKGSHGDHSPPTTVSSDEMHSEQIRHLVQIRSHQVPLKVDSVECSGI